MNPVSVKQLNLYVKSLIDGDKRLSDIAVIGELSNFKNHYASGHWYFTLKDSDAAVRCVMFRSNAVRVKFVPEDGMQVIIRGRASVYEKDGQYQLYAEEMLPAGDGGIAFAVEQIRKKLEAEGMFDTENKRTLPKFPKRIAVVTSETGAAVQDIINILTRRYPVCEIMLCPVSVQGENAVGEMLDALDRVYKLAGTDLIIIGRGGGSIEDLWAFNSEKLARKIYESPVPVISAVGHETDFTISDFAADLRAPTPSAAAELAVPDVKELIPYIEGIKARLNTFLLKKYDFEKSRYERIIRSGKFSRPELLTESAFQQVDYLTEKLNAAEKNRLNISEKKFVGLTSRLDALSPLKVMARGFSVAEKNKKIINSIKQVSIDDEVNVKLTDGEILCTVKEVNSGSC